MVVFDTSVLVDDRAQRGTNLESARSPAEKLRRQHFDVLIAVDRPLGRRLPDHDQPRRLCTD